MFQTQKNIILSWKGVGDVFFDIPSFYNKTLRKHKFNVNNVISLIWTKTIQMNILAILMTYFLKKVSNVLGGLVTTFMWWIIIFVQ